MRKRNNQLICRDSEARFFGTEDLAFDCAEKNVIDDRFNKEKENSGKDSVISFCKRSNLLDCSKINLVGTLGFSEVKVTTCFNNLRAVFEKHNFAPSPSPLSDEQKIRRG